MSETQKPLVPQDRTPENRTPENRSLADRAYDLFGELLLERETAALLAEIEADEARGEPAMLDGFFAKQDAKHLAAIGRHFRRHRARVFFRETLPRVGQIAAIVIALAAVAGGVAIAASHTIRVQVLRLLTSVEQEYTELKLQADPTASFDIPAEWGGENYPSFIPEGFALGPVHANPSYSSVSYTDTTDAGRKINFSELGEDTEANLDTENAALEPIQVSGHPGTLVTKLNRISAYWDDGRHYFILITSGLDRATFLRMAAGVVRVR